MSRIGKLPIEIDEKVSVKVSGQTVFVEGPKGKIEQSFDKAVSIELVDNTVVVKPASDSRLANALYGTVRSIINGMVIGVVSGYEKELEIQGVGFRADLKGTSQLDLALGYSHIIHYKIPEGVKVTVNGGTALKVEGVNKQMVGQVAASIRSFYPAEPYKGKGVRIKGEYVRRKEGKKTA